ncbi:MAG: c-type cytochrome biogenesis protein CcsB, partial [Deltaproteobacteria bacterium]|nr:c-type cytochrome biogenesis protein CcsB [Deltaproteobacteria bacterium]
RAAILSIVGFLATIMCYLGVNLILSGLHSYGGG